MKADAFQAADQPSAVTPGLASRAIRTLATAGSGAVAAISGIAPHVLHHVGPLAGTAILAGAGGTVLFGLAGLALSVPMLLRLRRRFGTWVAPAIATVIFTGVYLVSALVVGPAITADRDRGATPMMSPSPSPDHAEHH
jgi:putative copper export protein